MFERREIERADQRSAPQTRSVILPGKPAVQTTKGPKAIAAEIRMARREKRTETMRR